MTKKLRVFSLPTWGLTRWLADPVQEVPLAIRHELVASLFGTLPIFIGGVVNTVLVSAVIAARQPTPMFMAWFTFEAVLGLVRTAVILMAFAAAESRRKTPTDLYLGLALFWAFGVGAGSFISLLSGDWVTAALACLSSAAMMGGICFRNFAAPRLATAMIVLSFGPTCLGAVLSGELVMLLTALQIPFYLYAMSQAVSRLAAMLVTTMQAELESEYRAQHDELTGMPNRRFLVEADAAAASEELVLAIVDLDHFKSVNDTYGHQAGDAVLKTVGRILTEHLAPFGVVGRLGGEEFALVASKASVEEIYSALEKLLPLVAQMQIVASGAPIRVTLSAGIAIRGPSEPFSRVYSDADEALYRAKRAGRNRIDLSPRARASHHADRPSLGVRT